MKAARAPAAQRSPVDSLRSQPFAAGLTDDILQLIAGCASNAVFHAGDYLMREGAQASPFHLIRHGSVALEMHVPPRGALTFQTIGEGELLGTSWLVPPYRWMHDARAVTLVRTLAFDATCLRAKCEADPAVGYAVLKRFTAAMLQRLQQSRLQCAQLFEDQRYDTDHASVD